ncbi:hypothetical protein FQN51_006108 [Onygenales sp. PD_10]|nr:hypothetical protein FQN51_006108 [Onygenales sp. PD_10]
MDNSSITSHSRSNRPPLRDASNRANIPRRPKQQPQAPPSSPPIQKQLMSIQSSDHPGPDDSPNPEQTPTPPGTTAENKRISMVVDSQPNSNRNSAISTTSTASGKSRRKTHIGPWQLGKTLGKGATGRVRLAKHALTGQTAAIKIVSKKSAAMAQSQSIAAMDKNIELSTCVPGGRVIPCGIEREVVIMKLIEHPNIINLYDVWENRGELYLVLEYVEGGELFDYVSESGPLPEIEAVRLFRQIIAGLSYCHRFNICHRDLKPENILLDSNCNIKLADFGMAALQPAGHWLNTSCGSPHYASPEIIYGQRYHGDKADIWSCGIILFAMLAGYLPFDGGDLPNTLRLVKKGEYVFPPWLSPEAMNLVQRILQKQPDERITINDMWNHPLLKKYEKHHLVMSSEGASLGPPPPLSEKDCGKRINRRQDIDMELLRSLQTLWHGSKAEELISRLLSDEINHEKMFYHALAKFRDEQLEHYEGPPMGYSTSDYHHISKPVVKPQLRIPSSRQQGQSWRRSQFSIATDRSGYKDSPYNEPPKSARTIASYDPYRSSRTPISDPQVEFANVIIHRQSSESQGIGNPGGCAEMNESRAHLTANGPLSKDRSSFGRSSSVNGSRWDNYRKGSMVSFQSRSSIASSRRRAKGFAASRSTSYKRNVQFRHTRKRSTGRNTPQKIGVAQTHSQYSLSPDFTGRDGRLTARGNRLSLSSDRFSSPTLPTPPPPVRTRKSPGNGDELDVAKHRVSGQYWKDEARKVSTELGKICEEAFNRTSVSSSFNSVHTSTARHSDSPPTSVSTPGDICRLEEQYKMRPLPEPPAESFGSYTVRELAETRRRLIEHSFQASVEGLPQYLSEVIAHLDRLIGNELTPDPDKNITTIPETSEPAHESYLPSISEDDIFQDCTAMIEDIQRQPNKLKTQPPKIGNWEPSKTIRIVPPSPVPAMDTIKPLTIRKKSSQYSTHKDGSVDSLGRRTPVPISGNESSVSVPTSRRSSAARFYAGLEPIEEHPKSPRWSDARSSGESRKWTWFKHKPQLSQDEIPPPPPTKDISPSPTPQANPELGKRKSVLSLETMTQAPKVIKAASPEKPKGRFWLFGRKKTQKQKPVHEIAKGKLPVNDLDDGTQSMLSLAATAPETPTSPSQASSQNNNNNVKPEQRRPSSQNWFARFFHLKPASKTLAFSVSKTRARKEIVKILQEWKKYGMEDIKFDKETNIVTGRVAEINFLRLSPVELSGEFFTVLEHGRHANLSLLHLKQERGAASSFHKVVDTLQIVLKQRGLLIDDSAKAKKMMKVLNMRA